MPGISTNRLRCDAAKAYLDGLSQANPVRNLYCYIARTTSWIPQDDVNENQIVNDNSPPFSTDDDALIYNVWKEMFHVKKISPTDCTLAIKRYNWTKNQVYRQYDTSIDFFDPLISLVPMYVVTDEFNVYKCLYNNFNQPSFVKPTGTFINSVRTSDGYIWKFMYNISSQDIEKFVTNEWIPVKTLTIADNSPQWSVQQAAIPGALSVINVENSGFGYITPPTITITGDGQNASAICTIQNGSIKSIILVNSGENYTFANVSVSSGQITGIQVTNPGSGYISPPTVTITGGGGSGATAVSNITNGSVTSIQMTNVGQDYTSTPTVIISDPNSGITAKGNPIISGGASLTAIISPPGGHGSNPVYELGGFTGMFTGKFLYDENKVFTVNNDFRRIGLLLNPIDVKTNQIALKTIYTQAYTLQLSTNVTGIFSQDEHVSGLTTGTQGIVLDYDSVNFILRVISVSGSGFVPGELIANSDTSHMGKLETSSGLVMDTGFSQVRISGIDPASTNQYVGYQIRIVGGTGVNQQKTILANDATTKIVTVDSDWQIPLDTTSVYSIANIFTPELKKNSGSFLTVENRQPIIRSENQAESFAITVQF